MEAMSRQRILEVFRSRVKKGDPLIGFGAGSGLTALAAQKADVDFISIYGTAICRVQGIPSIMSWLPYDDMNQLVLKAGAKILPLIKGVPVFAGVGAHDPRRELVGFVGQLKAMGFSGVNNEPFCCQYGPEFAAKMEAAGIGFSREVELIAAARAQDLFTFAWVASPWEAAAMAEAGADMLGVMARLTKAEQTLPLQQRLEVTCQHIDEMIAAGKAVNGDVLSIAHGDAVDDAESAAYALLHTEADGYATGSNGERIPAEQGIMDAMKAFKKMRRKE